MALNFDFSKTEWITENGDIWHPVRDNFGQQQLHAALHYIVMASSMIGMPSITKANVDEFVSRCRQWEENNGAIVSVWHDYDHPPVSAFDEAVIRKCVGYRANVSPIGKREFAKRLKARAELVANW